MPCVGEMMVKDASDLSLLSQHILQVPEVEALVPPPLPPPPRLSSPLHFRLLTNAGSEIESKNEAFASVIGSASETACGMDNSRNEDDAQGVELSNIAPILVDAGLRIDASLDPRVRRLSVGSLQSCCSFPVCGSSLHTCALSHNLDFIMDDIPSNCDEPEEASVTSSIIPTDDVDSTRRVDRQPIENTRPQRTTSLSEQNASSSLRLAGDVFQLHQVPRIYLANEPVLDVETSMRMTENMKRISSGNASPPLYSKLRPRSTILGPTIDGGCQGLPVIDPQLLAGRRMLLHYRHLTLSLANSILPVSNRLIWDFQNRCAPFQISRTNPLAISKINHYQLRNNLVCTSRSHAFYTNDWNVLHVDPSSEVGSIHNPRSVMDLESLGKEGTTNIHISTLNNIGDNILMAGTFGGQYAYINLDGQQAGQEALAVGRASNERIINYIDSTPNSPNGPTAVIACNDHDKTLAFVDCTRNQVIETFVFQKTISNLPCPQRAIVNCASTSADGRIRVLVGDFASALITDARTSQIIHEDKHTLGKDGTFACAWAPSGPMFATAGEDKMVRLWDARMWKTTAELMTFMAPVRNLKFSPLGQGPPLLFAGEATDLVHVLDVGGNDDMWWTRNLREPTMWQKEQTLRNEWTPSGQAPGPMQLLHHFGDNEGIAMSPDGGELMVANGDAKLGGLMIWERTSWARPSHRRLERRPRIILPEHEAYSQSENGSRKRRRS
jgi:WD40 repeat protein